MAILFYDHLIDWERLHTSVRLMQIEDEEIEEVLEHLEETIHTEVFILIFELLPKERHEDFLDQFHAAPYNPTHLTYLHTHVGPHAEHRIKQRSSELIDELILSLLEDDTAQESNE